MDALGQTQKPQPISHEEEVSPQLVFTLGKDVKSLPDILENPVTKKLRTLRTYTNLLITQEVEHGRVTTYHAEKFGENHFGRANKGAHDEPPELHNITHLKSFY